MNRVGIIITLCILSLCMLASAAMTAEQLQMPAWPKDFSLAAGEHVLFGIPNPGAGTISVKLAWTGSPLAIGVTGSDKRVLVAPATESSPSYDFSITANGVDPAKCPVIFVAVALQKQIGARASGKISVVSPAIESADFRQLVSFARQQTSTRLEATQQQADAFYASVSAAVAAQNAAREDQNRATTRSLQATAQSEDTQMNSVMHAMAAPTSSVRIPAWKATSAITATKGKVRPLPITPAISTVTPAQGMSGAQVTISGVGLNDNATEVFFTIADGVDVPANVISYTMAGNGVATIVAQVPEKAGVTTPYDGQVYAKADDWTPVFGTNKLSFHFEPIVVPSITYIDPVEVGPQTSVNLDGNNFTSADVIHFVIPGVSDYPVPTTFVNATRLSAQVPLYSSRQIGNGSVYVLKQTPKGPVNSQWQSMVFKPTTPLITDLPTTGVADSPILIRGMSFGQTGEVHCIDSVGVDTVVPVDSWSDTHITTHTPAPVGFTGTKPYRMYVKNSAGKSDPWSIGLTPTTDHVIMDMIELKQTKDYKCSDKGDGTCNADWDQTTTIKYMTGHHSAGMFDGHKDDDTYFNNRTFANGWTIESIGFRDLSDSTIGGAAAGLDKKPSEYVGASSPHFVVHWWCEPMWNHAYYEVCLTLQGPKGTAY